MNDNNNLIGNNINSKMNDNQLNYTNNMSGNQTNDTEKKYDFSYKPKKKVRNWLGPVGMCEICGRSAAVVNLDLTAGTHRECRYCWDFV